MRWIKRHRLAITSCVALVGICSAISLFVSGKAVNLEFYAASAAAIPVFLLALLIRLSKLRDTVLEMLDDASDKEFSAEVQELKDSAEGEERQQELAKVVTSRQQMTDELQQMVPSIFGSLGGTYFLAILGEGGSLLALGRGASSAWTLIAASVSLAGIVASLIHLEVLDYRLQFADRGLLMTWRGLKRVDLAEYARTHS